MLEKFIQPLVASLNLFDSMQALGAGWSVVLAQTVLAQTSAQAAEVAEVAANNWKGFYDVGLFGGAGGHYWRSNQ